jgi:hypothetical protein
MTRRSEDLLDLFRPAPRRGGGGAKAGTAPRARGGGGPVLTLGRRQAMLAGSGIVLVLVLAFVAGIGIGRGKRGPEASPAAFRLTSTPHALISAPIAKVGLRGEPLYEAAYRDLLKNHPEFEGRVDAVWPADERARAAGSVCLRIKGFPDRSTAQAVQFQLAVWGLTGAGFPFSTSVPEPER